jgi:hypothetical protein
MAHPETPTQILPASPAPIELPATSHLEQATDSLLAAGRRITAVAFAAGAFILAGGQAAEAAPAHVTAQAESQGSGLNWPTAITLAVAVASAATGVVALGRQTREKRHDRFIDALKDVAGTSDAAQLQARINILAIYAKDPLHKPDVFITAVEALRARRATIIELREGLEGEDPKKRLGLLDHRLATRRNADRKMLELLTETRPAVVEQLERVTAPTTRLGKIGHAMGRIVGLGGRKEETAEDKLQALRTVTGLLPTRNRQLVDAAGINLDLMRDTVADCDLSNVDFTGAGLQGNNFENVVFADCDLGEAQLEGTTMVGCDLSGADFQAAYFAGDPEDPYFMGHTRFENCIIDSDTKFGHRPDNHPKAFHLSNDPDHPQAYRGDGKIILRNLRSRMRADGTPELSNDQIIAMVKQWQENGLELADKSDPEYFLHPPANP